MRNYKYKLIALIILPTLFSASAQKNERKSAPIKQEMDGLFAILANFLPMILNKAAFEDPKNSREIAAQMNRLKDLSTIMTKNSSRFVDNDPSIEFISARFRDDVSMAIEMWNTGDRIVPRRLLRHVTDYCISCHTRTGKGLHISDMTQTEKFKALPSLVKAEYFAATRQFEDALKKYENVIVDRPLAKIDPQEWNTAVRKMLDISIRVKKSPALTLELLSRIQDNPSSMPGSMSAEIASWRESAKKWTKESRTPLISDKERFESAKKLVLDGEVLDAKIPGGALVEYMRASSLLHDLLGRSSGGSKDQELLWLSGQASEYLKDLNLWTMQDVYYTDCIRQGKNASISHQCLGALEKSMLRTYGATTKDGLPIYARHQLDELSGMIK